MKCPKCGEEKQKVVNTQSVGEETYRKRVCLTCKYVFVTYEKYSCDATYKPRSKKGLALL